MLCRRRPCDRPLIKTLDASLRDVSQPLDGGVKRVLCDLAGRGPLQLASGFLQTYPHALLVGLILLCVLLL